MSPSSKKFKKQSSSKAVKPPREDNDPSLPSFSSLPDEIVLDCLQRVPRSYYLNLCRVSKTLRSLVRSPELSRLRSLLPKNSVYVSFSENNAPHTIYRWFTLKKTTMKTAMKTFGYKLVKIPIPFPSHHHMYNSSAVAVGSEIYFVGGSFKPLSDLWILDTRTGTFTQGPSMKVARTDEASVGVINGKIYVIGGCEDKRQAEVFDPKFTPWKLGESVCMIREKGLMGFDVNRKVWVKVVGLKTLNVKFDVSMMAEYDGKLAILWSEIDDTKTKKEIWCSVIALDWIGEGIRGTIEWSGIVATMPDYYEFHNCLVVSD
ncbi:Kelch repeat type 1 [Arabidopsis thaliana x Arabidopsis arenosa]|uniref:Kelch repeat type 1 n=1 Tax=Arabidopsis thaliana x Arabidopsis arenosa TaxID=1240361 RepID=A0A8T2A3N7_9BRAS|nr:Kelch repeat type 1 [Arabidopsis thaliana x Arabidopsis arenosa]